MNRCKCAITGKFLPKSVKQKEEVLMAIRTQSIFVAGLLAIVATAIGVTL